MFFVDILQAQDAQEDLDAIQAQRSQIVGMAGSLPALRDTMLKCVAAHCSGSRTDWWHVCMFG